MAYFFEEPRGGYGNSRSSSDYDRNYNEPRSNRGRYGREEEDEEDYDDYDRDEDFENEYEDYDDDDYGREEDEDYNEYETGRGRGRERSRQGFASMPRNEVRRIAAMGGNSSPRGHGDGRSSFT